MIIGCTRQNNKLAGRSAMPLVPKVSRKVSINFQATLRRSGRLQSNRTIHLNYENNKAAPHVRCRPALEKAEGFFLGRGKSMDLSLLF